MVVAVDRCPSYRFNKRFLSLGVEALCLMEEEDKVESLAFALQQRPAFDYVLVHLRFLRESPLPLDFAEDLARLLPDAKMAVLSEHAHWVWQQTVESAEMGAAFLDWASLNAAFAAPPSSD